MLRNSKEMLSLIQYCCLFNKLHKHSSNAIFAQLAKSFATVNCLYSKETTQKFPLIWKDGKDKKTLLKMNPTIFVASPNP